MTESAQTPSRRRRIAMTVVVLVALLATVAFAVRTCQLRERRIGLNTTLVWTGLGGYPVPTDQIDIEHRASMFTREFNVHFKTSPDVVEQWLSQSACTTATTPEIAGSLRTYRLKPAGGAQFAEVRVDMQSGDVWIRTYWS